MAKSDNQKLKLLYIADILRRETDELHPVSTNTLIKKLSDLGISVERKTIYSDIEYLKDYGLDIVLVRSRTNGGYYLASDSFELPELKLLVDMVQSSRFLTKKKSEELIKKLENMTSIHNERELKRDVYVLNRVKSDNENVYYNIDDIYKAINNNNSISFLYYKYSVDKELKVKNNGNEYDVSPYYLMSNNENYYLVGVDNKTGILKHYRIDRMKKINVLDKPREYKELFKGFDIAEYSNSTFGMFGGERKKLTIKFDNELVGVVIDRFGKDINIHKADDSSFTVSLNVVTSGQFYGWLAGLSNKAHIVSPESERKLYFEYIKSLLD